ncbi:hypothetical protein FS749_012049 [Ceratobasidium sp. UAMH 11750]|nr:hypothetical protein FS749_012049 [Ceratobasidium sp. UAMH 11750]
MAGYFEVVTRVTLALILPSSSVNDYFNNAPRLSQGEYEHAIRIFAPGRDVSEVDAELTTLYATHLESSMQGYDAHSVRLDWRINLFKSLIPNSQPESSDVELGVEASHATEPETAAISRMGLRIANAVHDYSIQLLFGARDELRAKLEYLIIHTLLDERNNIAYVGRAPPTPYETMCSTLSRVNPAGDDSDSWLPSEAELLAAELNDISINSGSDNTTDEDDTTDEADTTDEDNILGDDIMLVSMMDVV